MDSLAPRRVSGERARERGNPNRNSPPLPNPLLPRGRRGRRTSRWASSLSQRFIDVARCRLSCREFRGRVHQAERLSVFLHGLGELGVLLFLFRFDLALHLIAIGNVLHDGGGGGLMDFVVLLSADERP